MLRLFFTLPFLLSCSAVTAQTESSDPEDPPPAMIVSQIPSPDSLGVMSFMTGASQQTPPEIHRQRNDAMLNGALIALGALGIFDNVVVHWILDLHRAVPGEHALAVEIGIVIVSAAMLGYGLWRERQARRTQAGG